MEEQISKKDLLKLTGISYGQLYRWKREKLIPEDWFHKQSSATGQETFFPKDRVLKRVKRILELKDQYSLEELADMFSPEFVDRLFHEDELDQFTEITMDIAAICMDVMEKDVFSFREVLLMIVLSNALPALALEEHKQGKLIQEVMSHQEQPVTLEHTLAFLQFADEIFVCFYLTSAQPLFDSRIQSKSETNLQELSNQIKVKYQAIFHFTME